MVYQYLPFVGGGVCRFSFVVECVFGLVFAAAAAGIRYYIGRNSSGEKEKKDTCASKKDLGDIKEKS